MKVLLQAELRDERTQFQDQIARDRYRIDMLDRIGVFLDSHLTKPPAEPIASEGEACCAS
ncbi:MAG: hypothetical protein QF570_12640 [Myxococcota bacterium]|jgi:hypothetical protein|nr:hypothetical protein [Myxococcota bacterium]